jgi:hypothetical protein
VTARKKTRGVLDKEREKIWEGGFKYIEIPQMENPQRGSYVNAGSQGSIDACVHAVRVQFLGVDLLRLYSKTMRKWARSRPCAVIEVCNGNTFDDRLRVMSLQDIKRTD